MDAVPFVCLLSGPFPTLAPLLYLMGNCNAQNPLLTGFWTGGLMNGGPWQQIGGKKKREARVSLPLLLVLDSIPGSGHITSVASGADPVKWFCLLRDRPGFGALETSPALIVPPGLGVIVVPCCY